RGPGQRLVIQALMATEPRAERVPEGDGDGLLQVGIDKSMCHVRHGRVHVGGRDWHHHTSLGHDGPGHCRGKTTMSNKDSTTSTTDDTEGHAIRGNLVS